MPLISYDFRIGMSQTIFENKVTLTAEFFTDPGHFIGFYYPWDMPENLEMGKYQTRKMRYS